MSWLLEALRALGAGQQLVMGGVLLIGALYLVKAVKIGKLIGAVFSSAAAYLIAFCVAGGLAIALGWIDPNVGAATSQLATAADAIWSAIGDWVIDQTVGRLEESTV